MSAPDELKPCPFCGAPAYMTSKPPWVVTCAADACPAFIDVPGSTADDAAARWNRRAPTVPQGAEIARDLLAENEKLKRGIVSLQKKLDAARGNLQQRQRAGEKRNKRAALTPTDAETKG